MRRYVLLVALLVLAGAVTAVAAAGTSPSATNSGSGLALSVVGRFADPVYVTSPPGDRQRLFVVEKGGKVRIIHRGKKLRRPFLDISGSVRNEGERGMLSLAFAPDYARSRRFYVYFTDQTGDIRVQEFRRSRTSDNRADSGTRRNVITQPHRQFSNHNGGHLAFGPDGLLYISLGDGGGQGDRLRNAQNRNRLLGKLLRIDPRASAGRAYRVPSSNPFVGRAGRDEVYAYGLRNPFRYSFDRSTGDLALADVGQSEIEEVSFLRRGEARGANFGWRCFEGRSRFASCSAPGHVPPVLERNHSEGVCSITGGYVVRDPALPSLRGRYLHADLCDPRLRSARLRPGGAEDDRPLGLSVSSPVSFGEDAVGHVYVVSLDGAVSRIVER